MHKKLNRNETETRVKLKKIIKAKSFNKLVSCGQNRTKREGTRMIHIERRVGVAETPVHISALFQPSLYTYRL